MESKVPMSIYVIDVILDLILSNAKIMNAWPSVTLFRKNNHTAIGFDWSRDSPTYTEETVNDHLGNITDKLDFDVVIDVFFNSNSHKILELPLDNTKHKTVYYIDDLLHLNFRNNFFDSNEDDS